MPTSPLTADAYQDLPLTAEAYQAFTATTAMYPGQHGEDRCKALHYCKDGLAGEVGEISEKFKKIVRGGGEVTDLIGTDAIKKELGDVAWYLTGLAHELGFSLEEVLAANIEKLSSRQKRGVIHGEGDNR